MKLRLLFFIATSVFINGLPAQASEQTPKEAFIQYNQAVLQAVDLSTLSGISWSRQEILEKSKKQQAARLKDLKQYALKNLEKVKVEEVEGHVATVSGCGIARDDKGKEFYAKTTLLLVKEGDGWVTYTTAVTSEFSPMNGTTIEPGDSIEEKVRKRISKNWKLLDGEYWVGISAMLVPGGTVSNLKINSDPKSALAEQAIRTAIAKAGPLVTPADKVKLPQVIQMTFNSSIGESKSTSVSGPYFSQPGKEVPNWLTHAKPSGFKTSTKKDPPHQYGNPKVVSIDKVVDDLDYAVEKGDYKVALTFADETVPYFAKRPPALDMDFTNSYQNKAAQMEMTAERATDKLFKGLLEKKDYAAAEHLATICLDGREKRYGKDGAEVMIALTHLAEVYIAAGKETEADATVDRIKEAIVQVKAKIAADLAAAPPTPAETHITVTGKETPADMQKKMKLMMASFKRSFSPLSLVAARTGIYLAYKKKCMDDKADKIAEAFDTLMDKPKSGTTNGGETNTQ